MSTSTFAPWLRDQMRRREWNQTDLAKRLETHSSVISRWVRGERVPDPASCDRIADVFGLPVDDVLTLAGHRPATEPIRPDVTFTVNATGVYWFRAQIGQRMLSRAPILVRLMDDVPSVFRAALP